MHPERKGERGAGRRREIRCEVTGKRLMCFQWQFATIIIIVAYFEDEAETTSCVTVVVQLCNCIANAKHVMTTIYPSVAGIVINTNIHSITV